MLIGICTPIIFFFILCFIPDCESLVRKMLVCDPDRRYTVAQIKRHRWMQVEVPPTSSSSASASASATAKEAAVATNAAAENDGAVKSGRKCDVPINEGLMRVMGDLGIDTNMTREVLIKARKMNIL